MANEANGNGGNKHIDEQSYVIKCFTRPVDGGQLKVCNINPLLLKALGIELEFVSKDEIPVVKPATNGETVTLTEQLAIPETEVTKLAE